jgi:actin-related protein
LSLANYQRLCTYFPVQNTAVREKDGKLDINYDFLFRPLNKEEEYHVANPVDSTTGLWYGDSEEWCHLLANYIRHGYETSLNTRTSFHPLLLIDRSYNPPPLRQTVLELCMEELQVPAIFFARDAVMACYAVGRTTATVVDVGYSGTTATPVHDGYVETKGIRRLPVGSQHMDQSVLSILDQLTNSSIRPHYQARSPENTIRTSHIMHNHARWYVAQECREDGSGSAVSTVDDPAFQAPSKSYVLPDGTVVDIAAKYRFSIPQMVLGPKEEAVRDREYKKLQSQFTSLIQKGSLAIPNDVMCKDGNNKGPNDKEYWEQQFSEESSVGISKRRSESHRHYKSTLLPSLSTTTTSSSFHRTVLRQACVPYWQSFLQTSLTAHPIPSMIGDAALACDRDQQPSLLANVVLVGGGACAGPTEVAWSDALRDRTEALLQPHTPGWRIKVLTPNRTERAIGSWLGGSILGSIGTFHDMYITRKEYEEWGPAIVNRKCP